MLFVLIALGLIAAYAATVTVFAGALLGQQRMMNKMSVESRRRERRENKRSIQYLDALMQRTGITLNRRVTHEPGEQPRPSRNIVMPSQAVERQRSIDADAPKQHIEKVPPAIKTPFLRDAASNGAAGH